MTWLHALSTMLACSLATSCLTSKYTISREQVSVLSRRTPGQRGGRVTAVQQTAYRYDNLTSAGEQPPWLLDEAGATSTTRTHSHEAARSALDAARIARVAAQAATVPPLAAWSVGTVGTAFVLWYFGYPVAEGTRFDGTLRLAPDQPLHLIGKGNLHAWVPLNRIQPEQVDWATRIVVDSDEGDVERVIRRPLHRVGFTGHLLGGGTAVLNARNRSVSASLLRYGMGYAPLPSLSPTLSFDLASAAKTLQYSGLLCVDWYPLTAGPAHFGVAAELGYSSASTELPMDPASEQAYPTIRSTQGLLAGGSFLIELEFSTRLALSTRFGIRHRDSIEPSYLFGVSVY